MDAFAVSISLGLTCGKQFPHVALKSGLSFGIFQAGMAIGGWFLGCSLSHLIDPIDHWIAFLLLVTIGYSFIRESKEACSKRLSIDNIRLLLTLSIATSIDALATGVTFSLLSVDIALAAALIGQITYFASILGVTIGKGLSHQTRLQSHMNILGGIILILIGCKILLTHLIQGI